jgi:hypothetical protein
MQTHYLNIAGQCKHVPFQVPARETCQNSPEMEINTVGKNKFSTLFKIEGDFHAWRPEDWKKDESAARYDDLMERRQRKDW